MDLRKGKLFQETGKFGNRRVDFELKQSTYGDILRYLKLGS